MSSRVCRGADSSRGGADDARASGRGARRGRRLECFDGHLVDAMLTHDSNGCTVPYMLSGGRKPCRSTRSARARRGDPSNPRSLRALTRDRIRRGKVVALRHRCRVQQRSFQPSCFLVVHRKRTRTGMHRLRKTSAADTEGDQQIAGSRTAERHPTDREFDHRCQFRIDRSNGTEDSSWLCDDRTHCAPRSITDFAAWFTHVSRAVRGGDRSLFGATSWSVLRVHELPPVRPRVKASLSRPWHCRQHLCRRDRDRSEVRGGCPRTRCLASPNNMAKFFL